MTRLLVDLTEPILAPIRSALSRLLSLPLDLSPIAAILLIPSCKTCLPGLSRAIISPFTRKGGPLGPPFTTPFHLRSTLPNLVVARRWVLQHLQVSVQIA